ncbi:hypothetical protein JCM10213_004411 [Rhodosporidiobolus nylandii]
MEKADTTVEVQIKPPAFRRFLGRLQDSSLLLLPQLKHTYAAVTRLPSSFRQPLRRPTPPPATFPTPAEIREHGKLVQGDDDDNRRVWRIEWQGVNMYVKEGKDIDRGEVHLTELAREQTGLPIPKVYHVEQHGDSTFVYLEALPGRNCAAAIFHLSVPQRQRLGQEIARALKRLHRVKAPAGSRVGGLNSRPLSALFAERNVAPSLHSAAEFHAYLSQLYLSPNPDRAEEFDREIGSHFDDSAPLVLVHDDLHAANILVEGGKLSGIIDFGRAGWYPEWVERWTPELQMCTSANEAEFRLLEAMGLATEEGEEWRWASKARRGWTGRIES